MSTPACKKTIVSLYGSAKTYNEIQKACGISHRAPADWIKLCSEAKIDDNHKPSERKGYNRRSKQRIIGLYACAGKRIFVHKRKLASISAAEACASAEIHASAANICEKILYCARFKSG